MQVYIDVMLVKSVQEDDHLSDLQENFDTFWSHNMELNPNKCVFRVIELASLKTVKEVQSLNAR